MNVIIVLCCQQAELVYSLSHYDWHMVDRTSEMLIEAHVRTSYTIDSRRMYTGLETSNIFDPSAPRLGLLDLSE